MEDSICHPEEFGHCKLKDHYKKNTTVKSENILVVVKLNSAKNNTHKSYDSINGKSTFWQDVIVLKNFNLLTNIDQHHADRWVWHVG